MSVETSKSTLVLGDLVADLLQPLGDRALGDGLAQLRHGDVSHTCRPLPVRASTVSPNVSDSVGCGWMNWATSSGGGLPVDRQVALAQLLGHPGPDHVDAEDAARRWPSGPFSAITFTGPRPRR